jgi:aminoglycoside phosphotransferase
MKFAALKQSLPEKLAEAVAGYAWRENRLGFSATRVFHLTAKDKRPLYLKIAPQTAKLALSREKQRLDWLRSRLPVPEALCFAEDETNGYLLLSEIAGVPAIDESLRSDVPNIIEQSVRGLKTIHRLSTENCPFTNTLEEKIETARERMRSGLVDEEDFDAERLGKTARQVFREMIAAVPDDRDPVFTHGDYCVPNVIFENVNLSGFVDWPEAGIADRYQDLALLSRSVRHNFGARYEKLVFEIYGVEPDREKIRFYRLLDEFF